MRHSTEYTISRHLAICCENADMSGLDDLDIELIAEFDEMLIKRHGHALWMADYSFTNFVRCDIHGLFDDCVVISIEEISK